MNPRPQQADSPTTSRGPGDGFHPRLRALAGAMRCPECRLGGVDHAVDGRAVCDSCGAAFAVERGIPLLVSGASRDELGIDLNSTTGVQMVEEYGAIADSAVERDVDAPSKRDWLRWLRPPDVMYHTNAGMRRPESQEIFKHRGEGTRVLNVGGGPTRYSDVEFTMNLQAFHNVDIVGDAHNIPFRDASFDSVFCNAVLEHVHDPDLVVSEMLRVLRPGGYLYAEVPYIFFFHGYPSDYRRYTREGVRRMFSDLEEAEVEIAIGPVSAGLQSANILLQMVVPAGIPGLRKIVNGGFRWLTFVFKYLDIPLVKREEAHILAGGFYVIGRKPAGTRSRP